MNRGVGVPGMVMLCAAVACAKAPRAGDAEVTTAIPVLARVQPETISLGRGEVPSLTLTGSGFTPGGGSSGFADGKNTLHVGRASFERVPADSAGVSIRFALPLTYDDTSLRNRPAAFVPGQYPVTVSTSGGTSNAITLTMIR